VPANTPFKPSASAAAAQSSNLRHVDLAKILAETASAEPLDSHPLHHLFSKRGKAPVKEQEAETWAGAHAKTRAEQKFSSRAMGAFPSDSPAGKGFAVLPPWLRPGLRTSTEGVSSSTSVPHGQASLVAGTTVQGYIMTSHYSGPQCTGSVISATAIPVGVCVVLQPKESIVVSYVASTDVGTVTYYSTNNCTGFGFNDTRTLNTTCYLNNDDDYYGEQSPQSKTTFSASLDFPSNGFYVGEYHGTTTCSGYVPLNWRPFSCTNENENDYSYSISSIANGVSSKDYNAPNCKQDLSDTYTSVFASSCIVIYDSGGQAKSLYNSLYSSSSSPASLSVGAKVGIAIGVTAFVALVAGGAYFAFAGGASGSAAAAATAATPAAASPAAIPEVALATTNPIGGAPTPTSF